jgi:hypothetical protein
VHGHFAGEREECSDLLRIQFITKTNSLVKGQFPSELKEHGFGYEVWGVGWKASHKIVGHCRQLLSCAQRKMPSVWRAESTGR